jgi:hypothetical protein
MEIKLLNSTQEILNRIYDLTGKPVEFIQKPDLPTLAMVKIARKKMPYHLIYYKDMNSSNFDHIVAHECGHIYRMMSVPAEYRKVPAANAESRQIALNHVENELLSLSKIIPISEINSLFDIWFNGIIKQVTNFPVDMRIEKWIYDEYSELRKGQKITIEKQIRENVQGLSKNIERITPLKIYEASNYMNCAFANFMGVVIGKKYLPPYKRTKYVELGTKLANLVLETDDKGYTQDIEIINKWVELLCIENWFFWEDIENIPTDYLNG